MLIALLIYKCAYTKITSSYLSNQDIQNDVSSINNTQDHDTILEKISSLQHNISQLGSQVDAIRGSVQKASSTTQGDASLSNRLNKLEDQLKTLMNEIHNPVKLYQNCWEDTASCNINPDHSRTDYWRDCPTEYLPLQKEVCVCVCVCSSWKNLQIHYCVFSLLNFFFHLGMVRHQLPV